MGELARGQAPQGGHAEGSGKGDISPGGLDLGSGRGFLSGRHQLQRIMF